jgi:hypothetical protein
MNQFMESTAEKLTVLTRRTEPFSPSKRSCSSSQLMCNSSNYCLPSPRNLFPPALPGPAASTSRLSLHTPMSSKPGSPNSTPPNPQPSSLQLGSGTGHPRGAHALTRTLTPRGFVPRDPGSYQHGSPGLTDNPGLWEKISSSK